MEYKFCENCGAKMPVDSKFCTECGTPFPKREEKKEQPAPQPAEPQPKPVEAPAEPAPAPEPVQQYAEPAVQPDAGQEPAAPAPAVPPVIPQTAGTQGPDASYAKPEPAQPAAAQPMTTQPQTPPRPAQPVTPIPQPVTPPAPAYMSPSYGDPEITKETLRGTKFEHISAWGWFGIFLLIGIPLAGPLLVIIWACSGCRKLNKRTFARGILLSWLVGIVVAGLVGLALRGTINGALQNYAAENGIQYSEGTVVKDVLNSILNQYGYEIAD